jgi:hypothetical protein
MQRLDRLDLVMTLEATIGLAISAPAAVIAGVSLIVWRKRLSAWYVNMFSVIGRVGAPFARAATSRTVALVGCAIVVIGLGNAARLAFGLLS